MECVESIQKNAEYLLPGIDGAIGYADHFCAIGAQGRIWLNRFLDRVHHLVIEPVSQAKNYRLKPAGKCLKNRPFR